VLDHGLKYYQQHLKNLVTNDEFYRLGRISTRIRRQIKAAEDPAGYVAGATPLKWAAFQKRKATV
jgi:hypothetical protein